MQELFTRTEAAEFLRISVPQLDNLARGGEVRRAKFGEGPRARVLYRRQDLLAFVESHLEPMPGDCDENVPVCQS